MRRVLSVVPLLLVLSAGGCATADETPGEDTESTEDELNLQKLLGGGGGFGLGGGGAQGQTVLQPSGLFTTLVNANGTGCPKGTWQAGISSDGQTFTMTFSAYETRIDEGQASTSKDCSISVAILGTKKLKFEVAALYYQGYTMLETEGMSAVQTANYSFDAAGVLTGIAGIDVPLRDEIRSENVTKGPFDQSYTNSDRVGGAWSKCKKANNLQIRTRLSLHNDAARSGSGYFNTSAVDGSLSFAWKLNWQTC